MTRRPLRRVLLDVGPLRLDHDFRLLWLGQAISGIGNQITRVALPFQVYDLTHSTLAVGALAGVQLVPILFFALIGGSIADAVDRRRLLIATQIALATCSLVLTLLALDSTAPVGAIYAISFVAAGFGAVDQPARSSSVPRLVPRQRLPSALALNQLNFQVASVVGPTVGGLLIAAVGVAGAYAFDLVSFAASLAALLFIAPLPPAGSRMAPGLAAIREGIRFVRARRVILSTFVIDLDAMVFGMPTSVFPALALDVFRVGPAGFGLLAAAPAAGALVAAFFSGWVSSVVRIGRAIVLSVVGWGVAITGFGIATFAFPLALVLLAVAGGADVLSAVFRSTIVQGATPDELRGRVTGIHILTVTSGPRLGDVEAASVAAVVGPQASVVSGGVLCLLGVAVVARLFPELMRYRTDDAPATAGDGRGNGSPRREPSTPVRRPGAKAG